MSKFKKREIGPLKMRPTNAISKSGALISRYLNTVFPESGDSKM